MAHPGKILRAARAALDLSQDEVAEATRYDVRTIVRMEAESPRVSVTAVDAVKRHYESFGLIFYGETPERGPGFFLPKDHGSHAAQVEEQALASRQRRRRATGPNASMIRSKLD